ncbi:hypothetical protein CerSpe_180210 [Prunus speciosa]
MEAVQLSTNLTLATPMPQLQDQVQDQFQDQVQDQVEDQVSTTLALCDPSWTTLNRTEEEEGSASSTPAHENICTIMQNVIEEELKRRAVAAQISRLLTVCSYNQILHGMWRVPANPSPFCDVWEIRKTLTTSDVGQNVSRTSSRLLLNTHMVKKSLLPYWSSRLLNRVESQEGAAVTIYDCNTSSQHHLTFKYWKSSRTYVLIKKWNREFVRRRQLKAGDEIGFFWDVHRLMLMFSVLGRAGHQLPSFA